MNYLIHSHPGDAHSIAVACALELRGHDVLRDVGFGVSQGATFSMGTSSGSWRIGHRLGSRQQSPLNVDVVWFRRPIGVALPTELHPSDRRFAAAEWSEVVRAYGYAATKAFWVNPIQAITRAANKPTQLSLASGLGLPIPETLITNDVQELAGFIDSHHEVIFKPLHGALWEADGRKLGAYTSVIDRRHLSPAEKIHACPGIYQVRVPKAFEVRAQFFGASCFAVRIDSQSLAHGHVDWRRERSNPTLRAMPIELPAAIRRQCRELMRELDLVSGAFDFIVTPSGEWVFLEVNESGQFIFLEMWREDIPVLDAFIQFLESRCPDFMYAPGRERVRLAAIFGSDGYKARVSEDQRIHGEYRHPGVIAERARDL